MNTFVRPATINRKRGNASTFSEMSTPLEVGETRTKTSFAGRQDQQRHRKKATHLCGNYLDIHRFRNNRNH